MILLPFSAWLAFRLHRASVALGRSIEWSFTQMPGGRRTW